MIYTPRLKRLFSISLFYALYQASFAAEVPDLNFTGVTAGLVGKNISSAPLTFTAGKKGASLAPPKSEHTPLSKEMYKIKLQLNKVVIDGNHAISTEKLATIFQPFLHKTITLAKLQELVDKVTQQYENQGYFLSKAFLPPQQIKNGVVKVTVVEGFISKVRVQGLKSKRLTAFLQKYEKNIIGKKPIKLSTLERTLLVLNDIPGFAIKSVLAPDAKTPLGSTLTLVAQHKPLQATLTRDNYQTLYLGPNETSLYGSANSVLLPGGTLFARALSSDQYPQLHYYELKYDQTLGTNGLVVTADAYNTQTNPQFILQPLDIRGDSTTANASLTYPLLRSRARTLYLQGQLDYMSNNSTVLGQLLYDDQIRDVNATLIYSDNWLKGDNTISLLADKGLNILGADNHAFHSRLGAIPDYFKMILTASRTQYLTNHLSLYALITSQYANRPLFAAETMTFGGPYIGRGYDWAEFTGDQGVAGKAEFRINTQPNWPFLKQVQFYTFYDVGKLYSRIINVPPVGGASAGFGARAALMKHISAETFVGRPLTTPDATQVILGESGFRFQWYFQITATI